MAKTAKSNPGNQGKPPEISARNQNRIRNLIKVEAIVKKLNDHILGQAKMTNTMVRAAEILLRKIQPDLTAIQLTTDEGVGVPLLKIVRAAEPDAIEHRTQAEQRYDGAESKQSGGGRQIEHASVPSSEVMPD